MSKLMVEMQLATSQGGDYLQQFADVAGISAEEFSTAFTTDPISAIIKFTEGLGKIDAAGGSSIETLDNMGISEIRMRDALLRLANGSDILTDAVNTSNTAWEENTALQEEADKRYATTQSQLTLLKNKLMEVAISAGEELLPAVNDLVDDFEPLIENLSDAVKWFASLDDSTKEAALQFAGFVIVGAPVIKTLAGITKAAGTLTSGIGGVVGGLGELIVKQKSAGKTASELSADIIGVSGSLGGMTGSASAAGGAAALFTNPWVLGIGAVALAAAGIGWLVYQEMHAADNAHEEAIDQTKGKYEEWFTAVTDGAKAAVSSQEQIQGAVKDTGSTYAETVEDIKAQNLEIDKSVEAAWEGVNEYATVGMGDMYNTVVTHVAGIKDELEGLGLNEEQISDIEESYNNYSKTIGNTMAYVIRTFSEGKVMTADLASATITSNNAVKDEIVTSLTEIKDARQAELDNQITYGVITAEQYNKRSLENKSHYEMLMQTTRSSTEAINAILAEASLEGRAITAKETSEMIQHYSNLAASSGMSMTDIADGQSELAQSMRDMVSDISISSLKQSGALSESASSQIGSLGSVQEKIEALQWALDYYNRTGIPAKTINIDVSPALQAIADVQQRLYNIPDEQVYINVQEKRVYTATSPTGQQGMGYATGTNFHKGGLAILGDGGRKEPFLTPDGRFGVSPAVDTMYNLPRGSKVWSSIQKFKSQASNNDYLKSFIGQLPRFATGTSSSFLDSPQMPNVFNEQKSNTVSSNDNYNIYLTVNGDLPDSTIRKMATRIEKELKNINDRKTSSIGGAVRF